MHYPIPYPYNRRSGRCGSPRHALYDMRSTAAGGGGTGVVVRCAHILVRCASERLRLSSLSHIWRKVARLGPTEAHDEAGPAPPDRTVRAPRQDP